MSEKMLLVSFVDIDAKVVDYDTLKKEWQEYQKVGVLREYSSALFLYLSAKNYNMMTRLLNYEKFRILKKINRNNYSEILEGVALEDREYFLLREFLKRFNLEKFIQVDKETVGLRPVKQVVIRMSLETAVLLDVIDVVKNTEDVFKIEKGQVVIIPNDRSTLLQIIINVYLSMLQQLITQYRNMILQKYHSEVFEKLAQEEHVYEYKMTKFPPCIERALNGDIPEGHRNNVLFALANFLKASVIMYGAGYSKEELKAMLWEANARMPSPLPEREIRNIVKYHIDEHFFKMYGWCSKMKEAGLCSEKSFGVCLRKYFKKGGKSKNIRTKQ